MGTWEIGDVQDEGRALETSTLEHVNQNAAPIRERISGDDYKAFSRKFESLSS